MKKQSLHKRYRYMLWIKDPIIPSGGPLVGEWTILTIQEINVGIIDTDADTLNVSR